jgi:signal transduction histidine kinase/DNA-binding response OmpR family regulator
MMRSADPFVGTSEMAERMRAFDWSQSPLGPVTLWPPSLRSAISICSGSRFPMAIYWGPDLTLLYNDAWSPIAGDKHPWALGRGAAEVWPEIWEAIAPRFEHVRTTGESTYIEDGLLLMHRHGYTEECYFNYSFSAIVGEGGAVDGIFNAVVETTLRVISERRTTLLRELGERIGGLQSANEACAATARLIAEDGRDAPFCLVYLVDDDATTARLVAAAGVEAGGAAAPASIALREGGEAVWPLGALLHSRDVHVVTDLPASKVTVPGRPWPEAVHAAMIAPCAAGSGGRAAAFLVVGASPRRAIDDEYRQFAARAASHLALALSAAQAYELERQRAEALLEIDRAKTAFFSNVSHEFRTPLTLMLGPTEEALASPSRALAGEHLDTVYRNELRLLKLVNALLDFSRLEAGRMTASFEPTDLGQLTVDLASSFRSAFQRAGLDFDVNAGPLSEPVYVDREMWEKIVLNLLSNALKFTFEGRVTVDLAESGEDVRLTVCDTGIGIAGENLPRLFERFYRIEGARARTHEGSGIGLALTNDLVRLHGGHCQVESTPGRGTTVTVTLRRGTAHLPAASISDRKGTAPVGMAKAFVAEAMRWLPLDDGQSGDPSAMLADDADPMLTHDLTTAPGRVLVVDDNADMRAYLTRLLQRHWTVEAVGDGEAALEAVRQRPPDLVLSDVMMPGRDGFELLRALRADPHTAWIPVVMLSARAGEDSRIQGVEAGADDYLVKPFSSRELVARLNAQMRLARGARERQELLAREQDARQEADLQKQHLYSLFMQAPLAIVVLRGPDYVIELANPFVCGIWGRRHRDVINRPLFEALPELRGQVWKGLLDEVYATGRPHTGSETAGQFQRRGESTLDTRYLNFAYTPLRNAHGEVDGVLVIASDVTDQVVARREISGLREAAEAANRAKDEFLAMLGHELRNPLAPILTALQLLKLRGVDAAERERGIIERQVKHLVSLVDDLLDVSRITRGKIELRRSPVELADVVARAIEMSSPLLEQQRHDLRVEVPRTGLTVHADAGRLSQVVANLLTNAAKYTEPGGTIAVRGRAEGEEVVLTVRDTGIGIDAEMLPRIFDLFAQERQTLERSQGGLGLGLAIVRSLVAMHGGSVFATSEGKGRGAEFTIRLGRISSGGAALPPEGVDPVRPVQVPSRSRVLIVDDNHDGAMLLADMLSTFGYITRVVHDGPSALREAEVFAPQIALLDIGLPVMDGYELASRFKEHPRLSQTRLVAVTGYGQEQDQRLSARAGFLAHLVKPVDMDQLRSVLQAINPAGGRRAAQTADR